MATSRRTEGDGLVRIGAVARRAGVSADTIRYYERLGLIEPARRSPAGYRLFPSSVTERLLFIRRSQALGMTLEEVGEVLDLSDAGTVPCGRVRATLTRRLREVDRHLADLRALRRLLVGALARAEESAGNALVCPIIEEEP